MCEQIVQFCTGSNKPLLFAGGFISILLAIAIGYTGCTSNALYNDIDPQNAQSISLSYQLQMAAAAYLTIITIFSCYAAYYDQKHAIRGLAIITSLNFVLAIVAILMAPSGPDLGKLFTSTLEQAKTKYDFADKPIPPSNSSSLIERETLAGQVMNSTQPSRPVRWAYNGEAPPAPGKPEGIAIGSAPSAPVARELTKKEATQIWDKLQARGCCGLRNATEDWKPKVPKSCCKEPIEANGEFLCKQIDADHQQDCLTLIGSTSSNLYIVLALIALVNLYMATITGLSAYKTLH